MTLTMDELREALGMEYEPVLPNALLPWLDAIRAEGRHTALRFAERLASTVARKSGAWRLPPERLEAIAVEVGLDPTDGSGSIGWLCNHGLLSHEGWGKGRRYAPRIPEPEPLRVATPEPEPEPAHALVFRARYDSATGEWSEDWIEASNPDPRFGNVREPVA